MEQLLLIVDVQPCFSPPPLLVENIRALAAQLPSVATVERHNEAAVPFQRQHGWAPTTDDESLVNADHVFIKHGYLPPQEMMEHLRDVKPTRVYWPLALLCLMRGCSRPYWQASRKARRLIVQGSLVCNCGGIILVR